MTTVSAPFLLKGSIFPELPIFFYEGHIPICFCFNCRFHLFSIWKEKGVRSSKSNARLDFKASYMYIFLD